MYKIVSTGLGIGYIPKGGGTVASAFCCFCMFLITRAGGNFNTHIIPVVLITIVLLAIGTVAANKVEPFWGKDNYRVVIDEIAGMWISMLLIPPTISFLITGFILFRIFDIGKPFFIRKMEKLPGGIGVMMDDVLAGVYTNILLQIFVAYNLL